MSEQVKVVLHGQFEVEGKQSRGTMSTVIELAPEKFPCHVQFSNGVEDLHLSLDPFECGYRLDAYDVIVWGEDVERLLAADWEWEETHSEPGLLRPIQDADKRLSDELVDAYIKDMLTRQQQGDF